MIGFFRLFFRALLLGLLSLTGAAIAQAPRIEATDLDAWLDGYLPYALQSGDIGGAVVVVVRDGQVVTRRGYGWADVAARRHADPDRTLFRVGSITKLITWTAVMQQVEAGRLDLDCDVNAYLDFRIPPFQGRPITLRQLMTHTAGFEQTAKDVIATGNPPIPLDRYLKRWVLPRIAPPGTTPAYSNWGAALAGYIVQRAAGLPYADYVQQRIFAPLRMEHSTARQPLPADLAPLMARGYLRASGPPKGFEMIGPAPAGAVSSTADDMARFMIAHLEGGGGILAPQTAALMHAGPLDRIDPRSLVPPLDRARLGFLESNINGRTVIGHRGDTQLFHTTLQLFPDAHVGLFVSVNSDGREGAAQVLLGRLFEDFADRYFPASLIMTRVDPQIAAQHARMMAGLWQDSRRAETSFFAIAGLFGQMRVAVDAQGRLSIPALKSAGGAPILWDEIAPFLWQSRTSHERLAAKVEGGRVVRWSLDSTAPVMVYDRVPPARSSGWIVPALCLGIAAMALTVLQWPIAALVRRHYKARLALTGSALHAHRALRIACLAALIVLAGWIALLAAMLSDFSLFSGRTDGVLRLLQIAGIVSFVGAVGIAGWNMMLTWRDGRGRPGRVWSIVLLLAAIILLYVAWTFGLMAIGTDY